MHSLTRLVRRGYLTPSILRHSQESRRHLLEVGQPLINTSRFTLVVTVRWSFDSSAGVLEDDLVLYPIEGRQFHNEQIQMLH